MKTPRRAGYLQVGSPLPIPRRLRCRAKSLAGVALVLGCLKGAAAPPAAAVGLEVSRNGRFLVTRGGKPFFWQGDTAWGLFNRISLPAAEDYLEDRKVKGFNVIQVFLTARWMPTNVVGQTPFLDGNPTRLNPAFFDHVEAVIRKSQSLDLLVCLGIGDALRPDAQSRVSSPPEAYEYGWAIAHRFRNESNIIWNLGQDWHAVRGAVDSRPLIRATAEGIADAVNGERGFDGRADYSTTLMTYHASEASSRWFQNDSWLDFNMVQTWKFVHHIVEAITHDYRLRPVKPTLFAEGAYEDGDYGNGPHWVTPRLERIQAYLAVFAGAFGYSYGANGLWSFYEPGQKPAEQWPSRSWRAALDFEAGGQMRHLRALMESRPMLDRIPDASLVAADDKGHPFPAQGTRAQDGSYALVYLPSSRSVTIRTGRLSGKLLKAYWFNPRDGTAQLIGSLPKLDQREFAPAQGGDDDWVLVLDDADRGFPPP
jgi:Protein of unknown function (DUF4038)/Putative collagen-binding domain of a collagenase